MLPINNSDTAWLIVSDYNQDNDIPYEELREDIVDPDINHWYWEWNINRRVVGVSSIVNDVGFYGDVGGGGTSFGSMMSVPVGNDSKVGGEGNSYNRDYVGGSPNDTD